MAMRYFCSPPMGIECFSGKRVESEGAERTIRFGVAGQFFSCVDE